MHGYAEVAGRGDLTWRRRRAGWPRLEPSPASGAYAYLQPPQTHRRCLSPRAVAVADAEAPYSA